MQLDPRCVLSLASKAFYEKFCSHIPLTPTAVKLSTYTGENIQKMASLEELLVQPMQPML